MKILVIGSGGREHALVWKLAQSPKTTRIYCAPGNGGIGRMAELVPLPVDDLDGLVEWARKEQIDLTVVGPEVPLALGIVDCFEKAGLRIFGPSKAAARLEGSKSFAKNLMQKYGIPTATYQVFTDPGEAKAYIKKKGTPIVIKADGLAAGKGVVVARDLETALRAVEELMEDEKFAEAGKKVVIEEFLQGVEVSLLALTDGSAVLPMTPVHDHKAVYDGDKGPNTGGMGAFSPSHLVDDNLVTRIKSEILEPTISALAKEGIIYRGVLYAGLMLTEEGPKVLEFNARFGDPETQVILPRLKNDLIEVMEAVIDGKLADLELTWKENKALTVILASGGYPLAYEKGKLIYGLDQKGQVQDEDVIIFHAGTKYVDGKWLTNGGRVLGVTALGKDFADAKKKAYDVVKRISFEGQHYRRDIGDKAVNNL
ncbi:phosphoribosylamine--glycine ligase [Anoxybacter fermentans]|uniref:Phosphoribosylamine--glycine ligase n=1 Tax=Anoxybacter fermentans TaxID=1323375 RepID=A0A3Q9HSA4_9FIRM|nr:phosphoribosylamine--glycine ligase [Anoxybacter fermentans]AZR74250.1 phosphoribosylamine--glycine ligase [Anoxybacter fermentans]